MFKILIPSTIANTLNQRFNKVYVGGIGIQNITLNGVDYEFYPRVSADIDIFSIDNPNPNIILGGYIIDEFPQYLGNPPFNNNSEPLPVESIYWIDDAFWDDNNFWNE
jgi:hypothetical protein